MTTASTSQNYGGGTASWALPATIGALSLILGIVLLFNFGAAVATLVFLAGLSLLLAGVSEIALTPERTAGTWVLAVVFFIGGIMALAWPGMTLWALAVVAAVTLMVAGAMRAIISATERGHHWGWPFIGGIATFIIGVVAISWPGATVAVLALFLAIRIMIAGIVNLVAAYYLHKDGNALMGL